jgi:hypothetical protein
MARGQRDLMTRLAEAGEQAIQRLGETANNAERFMGVATSMRDRMDELQKKVRGLDALEKRLSALEKKVDRLSKGSPSRKSSSSGTRSRSSTSRSSGSSSRARKSTGSS